MNTRWVLFLFALFLFSCQDIGKTDKPENLIPEDKMVDVLTDLAIVTSAKNYNRRILEQTGLRPDVYIYEKHGIDSLQLARSTRYYSENYTIYENLNERVKERLERMKQDLQKIKEEEQRISDSIREQEIKGDTLLNEEDMNRKLDSIRNTARFEELEQ